MGEIDKALDRDPYTMIGYQHTRIVELEAELYKVNEQSVQLALGVVHIAKLGGMPDSYWHTDSHFLLALEVLHWTPEQTIESIG